MCFMFHVFLTQNISIPEHLDITFQNGYIKTLISGIEQFPSHIRGLRYCPPTKVNLIMKHQVGTTAQQIK